MFWDEFGFSFQETPATTWARIGQRPVLKRVTKDRRALSVAVGLTLSGKIFKRAFPHGIRSQHVIQCLQHTQRFLPGKMIVVWDRARIHKSKKTQAYLAKHPDISVEELPAYAPELNPEEYCHGNVKQHLRNALPTDTRQMLKLINRGFARLRRRPDLLLAFFHAAGLSVRKLSLP